jgi:hypothetical protein
VAKPLQPDANREGELERGIYGCGVKGVGQGEREGSGEGDIWVWS